MRKVSARRRESQGGYALLMIFLMAAIVALMMYQQLPRVAFESEREKEQLLIDRGEQYTRAIQLYYLANNRTYPTSIDDLEKREKRFLRRRFVDPFTGKDEWRIIHTNGGFLTDSLVQKPPTDSQGKQAGSTTTNAGNTTTNSGNAPNEPPQVNAAVLQRPSDRPITPTGFIQPGGFQQDQSGQQQLNTPLPPITLQPQQGQNAALPPITLQAGSNQPGGLPPITLTPTGPAGGQPIPGQFPGQAGAPQGIPGQIQAPGGIPGALPGGMPGAVPGGIPGAVPGTQGGIATGGLPPGFRIDPNGQLVPANPPPGQPQGGPGQPFNPQPLTSAGPVQGSPSAALTAINQLLTTPRQVNTAPSTPAFTNQIGAIAGIASTHKGPSIKVYKDQQKYELWEFVFSPTASTIPGGVAGGPGGPGGPGAAPGGGPGQPGGPGNPAPSTFAPSGTFGPSGGQPGFGNGPGR